MRGTRLSRGRSATGGRRTGGSWPRERLRRPAGFPRAGRRSRRRARRRRLGRARARGRRARDERAVGRSRRRVERDASRCATRPTLRAGCRSSSAKPTSRSCSRPADAVEAVEGCFERLGPGRRREPAALPHRARGRASSTSWPAVDLELGVAGLKTYVAIRATARASSSLLFAADRPELLACVEADRLGQRRTGAASAVAARHLARPGARSLGVIGCGWQAESQVECLRAALPGLEEVGRLLPRRGAPRRTSRSASTPRRPSGTATPPSRTSS